RPAWRWNAGYSPPCPRDDGSSWPYGGHGRECPSYRDRESFRMTLPFVLAALFGLLAIGTPVGFAMLITGSAGIVLAAGFDGLLGLLETSPLTIPGSYEFITIPLFLLMAEFILLSGLAEGLFNAAAAWVGRLRGGLGMATALAGAGFGAMCGTSTATAAALSATRLPPMVK